MSRHSSFLLFFVLSIAKFCSINAFTSARQTVKHGRPSLVGGIEAMKTPHSNDRFMSRGQFANSIAAAVLVMNAPSAFAEVVSTDKKGKQVDPFFEGCMSKCMYECTKPKGQEQKSRQECLPECKVTCRKKAKELQAESE
mmetsp:Transcript_28703/g.44093  ORF Transcript_28703/g.44093 Transcript_28703/m.44093 type:complete len:140 (+) Transcript_28703:131-550(+)|eukprot:CAMPEP_0118700116 /NCGR_PEP_ID=MMETSP0800-20121206/16366_1 /TAXON_ID=210618 ORGANISM="Striatella unipunctata, Strain CCMP2910" /NCGR_SAMPLE_ID=MMETSP0800 /ASSEMBLY_ACC=CAM_ASM_000638 /LENGTH=139 /DNA_ID=CAMNT_0006600589 /DNA_START=91 /DNA_END=510 /DNA_ORIENTATION=+